MKVNMPKELWDNLSVLAKALFAIGFFFVGLGAHLSGFKAESEIEQKG